MSDEGRICLDQPRWDQSGYVGRAKHFFTTTNPLNVFCSPATLDWSKDVVTKYRQGHPMPGMSHEDIWRAKHIYDSAFHPDTGEKMFVLGRMSAQVPMNMTITGCMMTFYKTTPQVVFWQWFNQSFNALVNYTNRSGDSAISMTTLGTSYVAATGGALATALGLNALVRHLPPLVGRLVPFAAVSAANCVNIPLMRRSELQNGVPVFTEDGQRVGESTVAARQGITMVVLSRIGMAAPGMVLIPMFMDRLEKKGILARYPRISAPLQIALCGVILTFATPLCCALFQQKASIHVDSLEPDLAQIARQLPSKPQYLFYNKGL